MWLQVCPCGVIFASLKIGVSLESCSLEKSQPPPPPFLPPSCCSCCGPIVSNPAPPTLSKTLALALCWCFPRPLSPSSLSSCGVGVAHTRTYHDLSNLLLIYLSTAAAAADHLAGHLVPHPPLWGVVQHVHIIIYQVYIYYT